MPSKDQKLYQSLRDFQCSFLSNTFLVLSMAAQSFETKGQEATHHCAKAKAQLTAECSENLSFL